MNLNYLAGYLTGYMEKQAQQSQQTVLEPTASSSLPANSMDAAKAVGATKGIVGDASGNAGPTSETKLAAEAPLTAGDKAGIKTRAMDAGTGWGEGPKPTAEEAKATRMHNLANRARLRSPTSRFGVPALMRPADVSQAGAGLPLSDYLEDFKVILGK